MRTYRTPPTDSEIATARRMRLLGEHLRKLNEHPSINSSAICDDGKSLPALVIQELAQFMQENDYNFGDLVAFRQKPLHWNHHCQDSLWILHRAMNSYSDQLKTSLETTAIR